MLCVAPATTAGLMVKEKVLPLDCGVVAFLMMRNPAPGVTTQSKGLLLGDPDGNEQTLSRLGVTASGLFGIALSGILQAASMSAPSSPAVKNVSPAIFSTSQTVA